jgi:sortase (surface protein transpeptidase)
MRKPKWSIWLGSALILGGAVLLAYYSYTLHERADAQRRAKEWLGRASAGHGSVPAPAPPLHRGDVVGEVEIPRLHLSVMIFEGDDAGILERGAGHIPGTALPSGSGNIGIAAAT